MNEQNTVSAWAFVAENDKVIRWAARRVLAGCWSLDPEEFRHDLALDVVERHHTFDPARGSASNWILMRAYAVRRTLVRRAVRFERVSHESLSVCRAHQTVQLERDDGEKSRMEPRGAVGTRGNSELIEACVALREALDHATDEEVVLVRGYLRGDHVAPHRALRLLGRRIEAA